LSADYLRGHIIAPPLEYTTSDRLLSEIKVALVEILHELKTQTELMRAECEMDRQSALKLEKISLQVHVIAVQMGRLVEK
jgi:hypothetical protein